MGGTRAKLAHVDDHLCMRITRHRDGHFDPPSLSYATASNRGLHELAGPAHGCGHLHSRLARASSELSKWSKRKLSFAEVWTRIKIRQRAFRR